VPHSRAFNERRKELYHRGRQLGLTAREAGHATSDATFQANSTRVLTAAPPEAKVKTLPSPAERQTVMEQDLAAQGTKQAGRYAKSLAFHPYHNYYGVYVRVKLYEHDPDTGEKAVKFLTVTERTTNVPTRGTIANMVRAILEQPDRSTQGSDRLVFDGFSLLGVDVVPDRHIKEPVFVNRNLNPADREISVPSALPREP
jgi:hypothetical protein